MLPLPLILGAAAFALWQAWKSTHPAVDKAAIAPGAPAEPVTGPVNVADNPPATVMPNQPFGLPPTGPALSSDDTADAKAMAGDIEADLETNGPNYNRQMMASFQRAARLTVDGLYGGRTMGALRFFLDGQTPYAAIFSPLGEITYVPPT